MNLQLTLPTTMYRTHEGYLSMDVELYPDLRAKVLTRLALPGRTIKCGTLMQSRRRDNKNSTSDSIASFNVCP